jgi:hypothetical protein
MERVAVALGQVQQPDEAGLALDERADRGALVLSDDQVAFPVPGLAAVLGRERPLVDRAHRLLKAWTAPIGAPLGATMITAGPQRRAMLRSQRRRAHQRRSRLVDGLVDALVTQPHRRLVREPLAEMPADLLRAPALRQQLVDHPSQHDVRMDPAAVVTRSASGRPTVRLERAIPLGRRGVAAQLARHRRRRPAELASDLTDTLAGAVKVGDLDPLVLR